MQKRWPLIALLLLLGSNEMLFSQILCGTDAYTERLYRNYPQFRFEQQFNERNTALLQNKVELRSAEDSIDTIRVVVHILHNNAAENISYQQVLAQIESTNLDLRRLNANQTDRWPQAADAKIVLVLASEDPNGMPTNGVIRKYTHRSQFRDDNSMKKSYLGGLDAWPSDQYLNIWVCDLNNKIGYAQMPGGPAETDGVVIDYASFGVNSAHPVYNLGRTLTHEFGHWMGLYHTYHGGCGGSDYVEDTPAMSWPSFGCQTTKATCGSPDMIENYMDASYDQCMSLFTEGQVARMRAQLIPGGSRYPLLGKKDTLVEEPPVEIYACQAPTAVVYTNVAKVLEMSWDGKDAENYLVEFKFNTSSRWMAFPTNRPYIRIQGISEDWSYTVRLTNICADGEKSESVEVLHGHADRRDFTMQLQSVSIYDLSGRYHGALNPTEYQERYFNHLDLNLPKGMYILVKHGVDGQYLGTEKWVAF